MQRFDTLQNQTKLGNGIQETLRATQKELGLYSSTGYHGSLQVYAKEFF